MKRLLFLLIAAGVLSASAQTDYTKETPEQREKRMAWFNEARFGMFIHWGLYAVPAGEWNGKRYGGGREWIMEMAKIPVSEYEKFIPQFNPVKFSARDWVRAAKGAGMRYLVITSKHHDGFGLWRSASNPAWSMSATPYAGDPLKELAAACREEDVRFCLYHSIMDWTHPDWGARRAYNDRATGTPDMDRYTAYMKGQLKELLNGDYGKIGILWFDGEWESPWTHERGVDLYNYVRGLQPEIIVNNRVGKNRKGMQGMSAGSNVVGDYGTPEQEIPSTGFGADAHWESCMTMNGTWGYAKDDHAWKSATTLVRNLIDCASKGGNYLLNVGPTAEGLIPFPSVTRLQQIGEWMRANSASIYDTKAGPFARLDFGRCTAKGRTLYLHVFDVPADRILRMPGLRTPIRSAWFLADTRKAVLEVLPDADNPGIVIPNYPAVPWDPHAMVVAVELQGPPEVDSRARASADGGIVLGANAARIEGAGPATLEEADGHHNIGYWSKAENRVVWEYLATKAGRYDVTLTMAVKAGNGGSYTVQVGAQKLSGTAEGAGEWTSYREVKLGTVSLDAAGPVRVEVRPASIQGEGLMNLRSVKLAPAP